MIEEPQDLRPMPFNKTMLMMCEYLPSEMLAVRTGVIHDISSSRQEIFLRCILSACYKDYLTLM